MRCTIGLINSANNEIIKTVVLYCTYKEAEKWVEQHNNKLNKRGNKKGLYWKVIVINS